MSNDISERGSDQLRRRLYEVLDDGDRSLAEKQRHALRIGREYLGVENGHIERIADGGAVHEVVASVGGDPDLLPEGAMLDRSTTYCRRTLEADSPIALSDAPEQGWADDPGYWEHGLDCYLGTTIFVEGERYGTVCFASRAARETAFTAGEKAFVELVARLLGRELESARHDRELEQSEDKYESLLEAAPDAIVLADAATGKIQEANAAAGDLVGHRPEDLVGTSALDMHPSEDREKYARAFDQFVEESATRDRFPDGSPLYVRRSDGSDVPVEMSASTVELEGREYVQGILRDISDRRERERELRVKNRAIDEASVGITIADATGGGMPLIYANREFERITGYDREAVLGENCRFLQGPDTDEAAIETVREAIDEERPVTTDLLNYRVDGTPFWNELTLAPVTDGSGETTHFVGFQRDITARKRRERLVAVLNRVLRHNLRNDMTVVQNYADALAEREDDEVAEIGERIRGIASDLTELSEKARTLETDMRDTAEPRARDVGTAVSEVVADLRETHPDATITVEGNADQRVFATERLAMAFRELGQNAVEHTGDSPAVTFRIDASDDGVVRIHVRDDGPGLDEMERRVLQTGYESPLEHGRGLGLWLVNWITTGVGGQVSTEVDDGTRVTLTFPRATDTGNQDGSVDVGNQDGSVDVGNQDGATDRYRQAAICVVPD